MSLPWVEKYRPQTLDHVVGNQETINRLKVIAMDGNLPNMIVTGSPGIGKTTSIWCLANTLLGAAAKEGTLELNASDDRGIDVVRNRIKAFAQKKVTLPPGRHKIVILDEADSMTAGAQQALRRTMEIYSSTTRFALACNQSSKIIEPIQSRCAILRFTQITPDQILKRLVEIVNLEHIQTISPDGYKALQFTADGDLRLAVNQLQAAHSCSDGSVIDAELVYKICDVPPPTHLVQVLGHCTHGHVDLATDGVLALLQLGYSSLDVVSTLFRVVKNAPLQATDALNNHSVVVLPEYLKLQFLECIGLAQVRIMDGLGSSIQLAGLMAKLCKVVVPPNSLVVP